MNQTTTPPISYAVVGIILFLWFTVAMTVAKKHAIERVVGHPVGWWDFAVISVR